MRTGIDNRAKPVRPDPTLKIPLERFVQFHTDIGHQFDMHGVKQIAVKNTNTVANKGVYIMKSNKANSSKATLSGTGYLFAGYNLTIIKNN